MAALPPFTRHLFLRTSHNHSRASNRWPERTDIAIYSRKISIHYLISEIPAYLPTPSLTSPRPPHSTRMPMRECNPYFIGTPLYHPFRYRMQLRSRFAQYPPTQSQQQPSPTALHPRYFSSSGVPTSSVSVLSGKHTSSYPSPSSSPEFDPTTPPLTSSNELPTPQHALLASLASQTLLQQFGSTFLQAFMTQLPSNGASPNAGTPTWDADKIRRVLEGKAIVSVVDVEPEVDIRASPVSPSTRPLANDETTLESSKGCGLTSVLEESMCALSLGKE